MVLLRKVCTDHVNEEQDTRSLRGVNVRRVRELTMGLRGVRVIAFGFRRSSAAAGDPTDAPGMDAWN